MLRLGNDLLIVPGYPALYVPSLKYLVLADLHLGFEEEMASRGVYLPRIQLREIESMISELILSLGSKIRGVLINGDVKHSFSKLSRQEGEEVEELLVFLEEKGLEVEIIRGNHDNYLPIVARRHGVEVREKLVHGSLVFTHGHLDAEPPGPGETMIIGHEHPVLVLRDNIGSVARLPCFLEMPLDTGGRLVIMPATGPYQSGNPVTLSRLQYLSPIVRKHGLVDQAKPYIVDRDVGVLELPALGDMADLL